MAHTELTITVKGIECEVLAEGYIATGGSNSYGSDEPAWCEVEDATITHADGRKLSPKLEALIWKKYGDYITDALIESEW